MRTVAAPESSSPLHASVAACLAAILEVDTAEVPVPPDGHPEPWTVWRGWLAGRGLGLVPIADPAGFSWPGPWIALLPGEVAAIAFGAPPGIAWHPLGDAADFATVVAGWVVAPADVAGWSASPAAPPGTGVVEALLIAPAAEAPMVRVPTAVAVAGHGLEGDRYVDGRGTFSNTHARGHHLTLVQAEALEELGLTAEDARRNVVTRGIDLNALVGSEFRIGDVVCAGRRLCEPCAHLARVNGRPESLRALVHRGGLRADVLAGGPMAVGATVA
jgi:hypothetical protein